MDTTPFQMNWLDPAASRAVQESLRVARRMDHEQVGVWDFLAALWMSDDANKPGSILQELARAGLDVDAWGGNVQKRLEEMPKSARLTPTPSMDAAVTTVLLNAKRMAGTRPITPSDLWGQMLSNVDVQKQMEAYGLTPKARQSLSVYTPETDEGSFIVRFCKDLTAAAAAGTLDPVVGRDEEIREAMNILQRRTKNNPVLVGEPGVGKTAMVEGLAQRMIKNEVPETLQNKILLSLDIGSVLAGAKYKGELEERVKGLIKEIQDRSDVVLFIDEIHTLVSGTGDASSIGNLLKPALARGELRCLGATTPDEYRQHLEKDPALERRFQKVAILEPSQDDAVAILRGVKDRYALHHRVDITDSALVAAVQLSARYIADRNLPDKAIDLMDAAAARVRTVLDSKPEQMDRLDRKLMQLKVQREALKKEESFKGELDEDTARRLLRLERDIQDMEAQGATLEAKWQEEKAKHDVVQGITNKMADAKKELELAQREANLTRLGELQFGIIPELDKELRLARRAVRALADPMMHDQVTSDQIAEVIAKWTGIPVAKMKGGEQDRLARMEELLGEKVIGQPDAVEAVSDAVRRSRSGLSDPNRPIGSFLFLGPTGVGKTELTKALSAFLFERKDAMVRVDMSEFMEKHSTSRLIGAPPGYVGYEEGGVLTEAIRQNPYSVILLDEVEKAHPDVFNVLLQVLDDGHLTDGQGRTVDFKNTVIIMTSNLGSSDIQEMTGAGANQEQIKEAVMQQVKKFFRPEFINRLDEIAVFRPLDQEAIHQIAKIQIKQVTKRLADNKIEAIVSPEAISHLAKIGFDPLMGARPLKRAIQQELENPLARAIVGGKINKGDRLDVDHVDGRLAWVATPAVSEDLDAPPTTDIAVPPARAPKKPRAPK